MWCHESQKNNYTDLVKCTVIGTYCKDSFCRAILSNLWNFCAEKELDDNLINIF